MVVFGRRGVRGRADACGHVGAGVSRRQPGCDLVLAGESCLSRDESVSRKRIRHTLFPSVHPSKTRCRNEIMSCVPRRNLNLRRNPAQILGSFLLLGVGTRSCPAFWNPPRRGGTPGAQILGRFMLQSRRRLRRHVKQSVQKFLAKALSRLRCHVGQWSRSSRCMHALWCLLLSAGVPRMRLCSSLLWNICSVGWSVFFFNVELVFLRPCLFRRFVVRNFSF